MMQNVKIKVINNLKHTCENIELALEGVILGIIPWLHENQQEITKYGNIIVSKRTVHKNIMQNGHKTTKEM